MSFQPGQRFAQRGGRGRGRGRGRGGGGVERQRDEGYQPRSAGPSTPQQPGPFCCDYLHPSLDSTPTPCTYTCHNALALTLHKADRHLIYPEGGLSGLKKGDPMLIAEEKERQRRQRNGKELDEDDTTIAGLNIQLNTEELVTEWIKQRKKRWPTKQVVEKKMKEREERRKRSELVYGPRVTGRRERNVSEQQEKRQKMEEEKATATAKEEQEMDSDNDGPPSEAGVKQDEVSSSLSDSDQAPTAISSKLAPEPIMTEDIRLICKHFLQNRCSFGDRCKKRHGTTTQPPPKRRPQPRAPPPNPFAQPDLLRQLLKNEIQKHVDAVAQVIRFIVDNDMLVHVEKEVGAAEEQKRKRGLVQVVGKETENLASTEVDQPVVSGALPVARSTLYRPPSPLLRPLDSLKYPTEPDPLIYLDPLRRDDPKPLQHSQLITIATDPSLRSILTPTSSFHPCGEKQCGLERALISLDALPTDAYRNAAIEMILGVSESNDASGLSTTIGGRRVTESDLFRLGLRVGYQEVGLLCQLADCVSRILECAEEGGEIDTLESREEARRNFWAQEGERLDRLRKLGIEID